jgi:hypothetical protein
VGKTRRPSFFIGSSHVWQTLHVGDEIREQGRRVVPPPHERLGSTAAQEVLAVYYIPGMGHGGTQYNELIGAQIDALEGWIDYRQSKGRTGTPVPANIGNYPREPAGSGQRRNRFTEESKGQ